MENEKTVAQEWEERLSECCAGFEYGAAPAEYRLTPESRAAIAEELYERMSRNDMIRRNSALVAAGIMPM